MTVLRASDVGARKATRGALRGQPGDGETDGAQDLSRSDLGTGNVIRFSGTLDADGDVFPWGAGRARHAGIPSGGTPFPDLRPASDDSRARHPAPPGGSRHRAGHGTNLWAQDQDGPRSIDGTIVRFREPLGTRILQR